ncbi:MAG TPA: toxin-antitoxin system HicB family antitoxin [Caldilineae bacterium]|jgi:predicted HicB family RNase H-like nuclease|nr:toxin-antitoxin system HicB family antitoxin [Caldilineae bacterium]
MGRLTVRLPETLHRQLEMQARREGVSLNQYIVYLLTRQVTLAYTVQAVPEEDAARQRDQFAALLQQLGQASHEEIQQVLAEREKVAPETELSPELVSRLQERLRAKGSSG